MPRARMTIYAPTSKEAEQELLDIAGEIGYRHYVSIASVIPQGSHNWLVTYIAPDYVIRLMEDWVS